MLWGFKGDNMNQNILKKIICCSVTLTFIAAQSGFAEDFVKPELQDSLSKALSNLNKDFEKMGSEEAELRIAIESKNVEVFRDFIKKHPNFNYNKKLSDGRTPLEITMSRGDVETTLWLLEQGAEIKLSNEVNYLEKLDRDEIRKHEDSVDQDPNSKLFNIYKEKNYLSLLKDIQTGDLNSCTMLEADTSFINNIKKLIKYELRNSVTRARLNTLNDYAIRMEIYHNECARLEAQEHMQVKKSAHSNSYNDQKSRYSNFQEQHKKIVDEYGQYLNRGNIGAGYYGYYGYGGNSGNNSYYPSYYGNTYPGYFGLPVMSKEEIAIYEANLKAAQEKQKQIEDEIRKSQEGRQSDSSYKIKRLQEDN